MNPIYVHYMQCKCFIQVLITVSNTYIHVGPDSVGYSSHCWFAHISISVSCVCSNLIILCLKNKIFYKNRSKRIPYLFSSIYLAHLFCLVVDQNRKDVKNTLLNSQRLPIIQLEIGPIVSPNRMYCQIKKRSFTNVYKLQLQNHNYIIHITDNLTYIILYYNISVDDEPKVAQAHTHNIYIGSVLHTTELSHALNRTQTR